MENSLKIKYFNPLIITKQINMWNLKCNTEWSKDKVAYWWARWAVSIWALASIPSVYYPWLRINLSLAHSKGVEKYGLKDMNCMYALSWNIRRILQRTNSHRLFKKRFLSGKNWDTLIHSSLSPFSIIGVVRDCKVSHCHELMTSRTIWHQTQKLVH